MLDNPVIMFSLLVILLAVSALFSGSETALMAVSKIRLKHLAETMPMRARLVEKVLKNPEKLIGTILLGNNLVNVAMSALATAFAISLWGEKGIVYVTVVLTFVILIFAEITPKVFAKYFNESVSLLVAPLFNVIMIVFNPLIIGVTYISTRLLSLFGIDVSKIKRPLFTESEVRTCIKMARDDGSITDGERKMLSRVFTLNDKTVMEVMVPKGKMVVLHENDSLKDARATIIKTGFSRFPVSKGTKLDIVGFMHAKDILSLTDKKDSASIKSLVRPALFISFDKKIDTQLRSFQEERLHQAVVLDERGNVAGLITLEDIVEELVGAIKDEYD
jgi:putative hemolysin